MASVTVERLSKDFGGVAAVRELSLEVADGEFYTLLGPSGCGKTTTLRMIAGFEAPSAGRVLFDGADMTNLAPEARQIGMVFQNYALFPHLSVFENVAFGLRVRKVPGGDVTRRVGTALELVELGGLGERKVPELSGGQQQRVALARALVIEPRILLLDEPLSNLDPKLRESTRSELRALQQRLDITTIYVTHDQEEALSLSDRLAVLNDGRLMQEGTPEAVYRMPQNAFVAGFVGRANVIAGEVIGAGAGRFVVQIAPGTQLTVETLSGEAIPQGRVRLVVRPEAIEMALGDRREANVLHGKVIQRQFEGFVVEHRIAIGDRELVVLSTGDGPAAALGPGASAALHLPPDRITVLPQAGGKT